MSAEELYNSQLDINTQNSGNIRGINTFDIDFEILNNNDLSLKVRHCDYLIATYSQFLQDSFGIVYEELAPTIEYIAAFAGILQLYASEDPDKEEDPMKFAPGKLHALTLRAEVSHHISKYCPIWHVFC